MPPSQGATAYLHECCLKVSYCLKYTLAGHAHQSNEGEGQRPGFSMFVCARPLGCEMSLS